MSTEPNCCYKCHKSLNNITLASSVVIYIHVSFINTQQSPLQAFRHSWMSDMAGKPAPVKAYCAVFGNDTTWIVSVWLLNPN